jgi:4-alpha-glucanotransferase
VNVPGTVNDANWSYRMPMGMAALMDAIGTAERLRDLAVRSGRIAP